MSPVAKTSSYKSFSAATTAPKTSNDIVIPQLVDTLEWVVESPPNIHQFEEPPVSINLCIISLILIIVKISEFFIL